MKARSEMQIDICLPLHYILYYFYNSLTIITYASFVNIGFISLFISRSASSLVEIEIIQTKN